jgi:hypothetical protein
MNRLISALQHRAHRIARRALEDERGDVPGWVLVTLMTAGIVIALWGIAQPLLTDTFQRAIGEVSGP